MSEYAAEYGSVAKRHGGGGIIRSVKRNTFITKSIVISGYISEELADSNKNE